MQVFQTSKVLPPNKEQEEPGKSCHPRSQQLLPALLIQHPSEGSTTRKEMCLSTGGAVNSSNFVSNSNLAPSAPKHLSGGVQSHRLTHLLFQMPAIFQQAVVPQTEYREALFLTTSCTYVLIGSTKSQTIRSSLHPAVRRITEHGRKPLSEQEVATVIPQKLFTDSVLLALFRNALAPCFYKWQCRQRLHVSQCPPERGNVFKEIVQMLMFPNVLICHVLKRRRMVTALEPLHGALSVLLFLRLFTWISRVFTFISEKH